MEKYTYDFIKCLMLTMINVCFDLHPDDDTCE